MEVIPGKPEEKETKRDNKTGNVVFEKTKAGTPGVDCRKKFLESFADVIKVQFGGDLQKAYEFCVGGRMIISDPVHQKALRAFSEGIGWFKKIILMPFGVNSVEELINKAKGITLAGTKKVKANYGEGMDSLNSNLGGLLARARDWRDRA